MKKRAVHQRIYGGVKADLRETERRNKLLAAGLQAFGTKGYAKTNIKTICRIAGLTERYFYESFQSKEELLSAVYKEIVDQQMSEARKILEDDSIRPVEATAASLRSFLKGFLEDHCRAQVQLFEVMGVSPAIDRQYQEAMRLLADMAKLFLCRVFPGISEETWRGNLIPTALAGSIILIAHEWVLGGYAMDLDDIIGQCTDHFMVTGKHLEAKSRPRKRR